MKCEPKAVNTWHPTFFKLPHRHRMKYSYSSKPPGAASQQASRRWPMGTGKIKVHLIDFSCLSLFILSVSFSVFTVFHQCNLPHSLCFFSASPQERRPNSPSVFVLMWSICVHTRSVSSGSRSSFYWSSNTSLVRFKSSSASLWKNSPSPELCKHFPDGFLSSVIFEILLILSARKEVRGSPHSSKHCKWRKRLTSEQDLTSP